MDDLFDPNVLRVALSNQDKFTDRFMEWIPENIHIFDMFAAESFKVINRGFNHYSARTIVEWMRHNSSIKENSTSGFKINDWHTPYLARLFDLVYPNHVGLWEYRETKKLTRKNNES